MKGTDGKPKISAVCSVTVQELMQFELQNDVNLPANVILTATTLSGLIAPGCHVSYKSLFNRLIALQFFSRMDFLAYWLHM